MGDNATEFANFIATLVKNSEIVSLAKPDWRLVEPKQKLLLWNTLKVTSVMHIYKNFLWTYVSSSNSLLNFGNLITSCTMKWMKELKTGSWEVLLRNGEISLPIETHDKNFPIIQYVDDTLLIVPSEDSQLVALKEMLQDFHASTGLKVNSHKSCIFAYKCG